jgi:hypothetical protein
LTLDKIPLFKDRIMPKGEILSHTDSSNRLLWFIEYEVLLNI